jgi:FKBP-type peptidyl-prolyl cis-trans isomerase
MKIIHLFNAENSFIPTVLIVTSLPMARLSRRYRTRRESCPMVSESVECATIEREEIMIPIRAAGAAVALAIIAAVAPLAGSGEAANQVIEMPDGLKYTDTKSGDGATAAAGDKVSVHYTGWLSKDGAKGAKFDSSVDRGQPFDFTLGAHQVIAGWDEGVAGMKVGSQRTLIIPPELGYGSRGAGSVIPPNATLIFDVELLKVQ